MKSSKFKLILAFLMRKWVWILAIIILIAAILSSVEIYKEEVLNIDSDIKYEEQNTIYLSSEKFDTLNPIISQSEDVYHLSKLIYNSLFDYDENMGVVSELVDSYTVNTEKAFIELNLKKGVKWHDGKSLNSSDVKFTISAIKAAGSSSPYYDSASKIIYVNTPNKNKVIIYFNNNYNCSLDDLIFPIVSSRQYQNQNKFIMAKQDYIPIGTGQYKYENLEFSKCLHLVPNEEYFDSKGKNDIIVTILPKKALSANMMEIEQVTCYMEKSTDRRSISSDKNYALYDIPSNNVEFMVFNTKKAFLRNKTFRKALCYGIDISELIKGSYMNDMIYTQTLYYPNFLGVKEEEDVYSYNLDTAKNLLSSLGYRDSDEDGYLDISIGRPIEMNILVNSNNSRRLSAARDTVLALETLGIKCNLISLKYNEYQNAITKGQYDILFTGYSLGDKFDLRNFFNGKNPWKYTNYDLSILTTELDRLYTPAEYAEKYKAIKEAFIDEAVYYPIGYCKIGILGVELFKIEKTPSFNDYYKNIETWSWKKIIE